MITLVVSESHWYKNTQKTFKTHSCLFFRRCLRGQVRQKETNKPDKLLKAGPNNSEAVTHNNFVLEEHEMTHTNLDIQTSPNYSEPIDFKSPPEEPSATGNETVYYATPVESNYYEATDIKKDQQGVYDTAGKATNNVEGDETQHNASNVYNTFKDFQQQDDYDHLGDHKKKSLRVTDNDYSTTQAVMSPATDDDTYNHLNEGPKIAASPDNVYGMTRAEDDYETMPPVSGTKPKATVSETGDDYSSIGSLQ